MSAEALQAASLAADELIQAATEYVRAQYAKSPYKHVDRSLKFAVEIDTYALTLRPLSEEGDDYFGLAGGTNGTAATCRRQLIEITGFRWIRSNGRLAMGIQYRYSRRPTFEDEGGHTDL